MFAIFFEVGLSGIQGIRGNHTVRLKADSNPGRSPKVRDHSRVQGGRLSQTNVTSKLRALIDIAPKRRLLSLAVSYSVHFGYHICIFGDYFFRGVE